MCHYINDLHKMNFSRAKSNLIIYIGIGVEARISRKEWFLWDRGIMGPNDREINDKRPEDKYET
jgi:hypothetical protein